MPNNRNFEEYHKSIADELQSIQKRVRNLIGGVHYPTDGAHKEAILRKVLKNHVPDAFHVGTGFVCFQPECNINDQTSTQIDILISDTRHPTLFKDGDLRVNAVSLRIKVLKMLAELCFSDKLSDKIIYNFWQK